MIEKYREKKQIVIFKSREEADDYMASNRTKGPKKRTDQNDADFLKALLLCVEF